MTRYTGCFKQGLKPAHFTLDSVLYCSAIRQLGNYKALCSSFHLFTFCLTRYQSAQFIWRALHYELSEDCSASQRLRRRLLIYLGFNLALCLGHRVPFIWLLKNLKTTLLFIDFSKISDSNHWGKMEQILLAYGLPKETVITIMMLYKNTKAMVCSPDERHWLLWHGHWSFARR